MPFSEARVENDYFVFEEDRVFQSANAIVADFVLNPKRDLKMLLTHDWLTIDDERGNRYQLVEMYSPAYFETCEYDLGACLEKDFKLYEHGEQVDFMFRARIVDPSEFNNNRPRYFKFLIKFLVFRPDGSLVVPVAIRVSLR